MKFFIILIFFIVIIYSRKLEFVRTKYGKLIGKPCESLPDVTEFLGVPFATPPLKNLRFKPPKELKDNYYGENFKAHTPANSCPQEIKNIGFAGYDEWQNKTLKISEDCLQLNIWVPKKKSGGVIVFIFGGSYSLGSPSLPYYKGDALAYITNDIVVNINYRLGVLGFAYYKGYIPGNIGLLDQQMALKWIKENIKGFGGNPKKITLLGHGSGAASAMAHLYSIGSRNLFKKIIPDSGTIKNNWAYQKNFLVQENFKTLASKLKCNIKKPSLMMKCMMKQPASKLIEVSNKIKNKRQSIFKNSFLVVESDDVFFKGNVTDMIIRNNMTKNIPILFIRIPSEAAYFMPIYMGNNQFGCKLDFKKSMDDKANQCLMKKEHFENVVGGVVTFFNLKKEAFKEINALYTKSHSITEYRDKTIRMLTDLIFDCEAIEYARKLSVVMKEIVYFHVFNVRLSNNKWPKWMGVVYGYELLNYFGHSFSYGKQYNQGILDLERRTSYAYIKIISDFINNDTPIKEWKPFDATTMEAFYFNKKFVTENVTTYRTVNTFTCREWVKIIKKYKK
uniref:Acetylcholinesterase n=1 Tax=Parastrongyloides trichosuri TaxID=131310 RepID=A0A0N4ZXI1_PARTI